MRRLVMEGWPLIVMPGIAFLALKQLVRNAI